MMSLAVSLRGAAFAAVTLGAVATSGRAQGRHALDPLSPAEITSAVSILRRAPQYTAQARFGTITVQQHPKEATSARAARIVGFDWSRNEAFVAVVDLAASRLASWTVVDSEPPMRLLAIRRAEEIAHADARWVDAMRARGIDTARVNVLVALGERDKLPRRGAERLVGTNVWLRDPAPPANHVEGVSMYVNLTQGRVETFSDSRGAATRPNALTARALTNPRAALPPLRAEQANGTGIRVTGNQITWDNWKLRVGVDPRRGLEIHDVSFTDGARVRPVLYSGSITEIVAPYGDPNFSSWYPRDEGDYGMGIYSMSSAVQFNDAPANAVFLSATMHDHLGRPVNVPRAIAIYERDGGLLWRHANESRRARQLVISAVSTIDNYDYQFNWTLSQDGAIEGEVVLSGIMNVSGGRARDTAHVGGHTSFGHLVAPNVNAPNHQHFFSYRLDLDVDGPMNTVYEMETNAPPQGSQNPRGEFFSMTERPLVSELRAVSDVSFASARMWRVANTHEKNALGQFTGFALVPGAATPVFALAGSAPRRMSRFMEHQLWVTPFAPDELYAGGEFQNLGRDNEGLATWTKADRALTDKDVVLWYTLGITHIPRPEDWPYMPAHRGAFRLVPVSFFSRNPVLDVPSTKR
jgi:primary-amine oxidase